MKRTPDGGFAIDSSRVPERSLTQRREALEKANIVRTRRATLKNDLKAGRASIRGVLLDPPEYIETAKVFDMLLAVPKYGRVKVNRLLKHCRISPSKTIGGLSQRQRDDLISFLHREPEPSPQPVIAAAPDPVSPEHNPLSGREFQVLELITEGLQNSQIAAQLSISEATVRRHISSAHAKLEAERRTVAELARGIERLVEEARQVGRLAGRAAREDGHPRHISVPRPDIIRLRAALRGTLVGELAGETEPTTQASALGGTLAVASSTPPTRADEHRSARRAALLRANELRLARAELRRRIADGTVTVSQVILTCPSEAASMSIAELLRSQRHWRTTRWHNFLADTGMAETKTIGSLTDRQRALLAAKFANP